MRFTVRKSSFIRQLAKVLQLDLLFMPATYASASSQRAAVTTCRLRSRSRVPHHRVPLLGRRTYRLVFIHQFICR
jgi:hypothetical protein